MLAAIGEGDSTVSGFLRSEDCMATMHALRALGVRVVDDGIDVTIHGKGKAALHAPDKALDLGNSGTAMRLLTGLLAGQPFRSELTGDDSLRKRPMERVAVPLRLMGADVQTAAGCPPIEVRGRRPLRGLDYRLPVASAQVKSAILIASLYANEPTTLSIPGVTRDHTEKMLESMGVELECSPDGRAVKAYPCKRLEPIDVVVPGDFSSAAFLIVAGCLGAVEPLVIQNVGLNSTRTGLLAILELMGASFEIHNRRFAGAEPVADLTVRRSVLKGIEVPTDLVPLAIDELPILFVAAAGAEGQTRVAGAEELRHKESDRLSVMAQALRTLGIDVIERRDGLELTGGRLSGGTVDSRGDHRITMSMVVASLIAHGDIEILDTAPVATSFPGFVQVARAIGFDVVVDENGQ